MQKNAYIILPFNFVRFGEHLILVNLVGEYFFINEKDFNRFISYSLGIESRLYLDLQAKHFIAEKISDSLVSLLSAKYRTKKNFLFDFTSLHMFVITLRCNHGCVYCHASSKDLDKLQYNMDIKTAQKAVDMALMSPSQNIKIEFQGGEPLLNFDVLRFIVGYAKEQGAQINKQIDFVVCTNLTVATDEMLIYLSENNVQISTSLDGPSFVHDFNRKYRNGGASHKDVINALNRAKKYMNSENISALMTTTKHSLNYAREIVDEYVANGFRSIFIRSLNPFGFAKENYDLIGYNILDFINFYKKIVRYLLEINQKGFHIEESFSSILLTRILTPFSNGFVDLQFPSGVGISGVIYHYDGNVYPSDEARMLALMGDDKFCLGNVLHNDYREIFYNPISKKMVDNTCAESLPGCNYCAFQIYCGIDPIRNYVSHGDIVGKMPLSDFCVLNKEAIKFLFELISENDTNVADIFWSWITRRNLSEIQNYKCLDLKLAQ